MARFCEGCGHPLEDGALFCEACGRRVQPAASSQEPAAGSRRCPRCGADIVPGDRYCQRCGMPAAQPLSQPQPLYFPPQAPARVASNPARKVKSNTGRIVGLALGGAALVALIVVGVLLLGNSGGQKALSGTGDNAKSSGVQLIPFPDALKVDTKNVTVHCTYTPPESIIPANYRSMGSIITMKCYTDSGSTKLLVTVEIPEFTQKYQQMIDVSRAETDLKIHPPLLEDAAKSLDTSKDAQLVVTVTDENSGKIIVQDTNPVKLYSRYDMQWESADGTPYYENILAWMTPEAPEIDQLLRLSADSCSEMTGGGLDAIIGYEEISGVSHEDVTYAQVCAMMYTMAAKFNVKYINDAFSATGSDLQRIKTPVEVLDSAGGLCIETALTMASAIEHANMHAVIILLPGHAQVAVETWPGSGEYFLIETTALDSAAAKNFDDVVTLLTKDQWTQYLSKDGYVAIDCDLANQLNIKSID